MTEILFPSSLGAVLTARVAACSADRLFILTDSTTHALCLPLLAGLPAVEGATEIVIPAGDSNKTLATCGVIWDTLVAQHATRHSLLVNLGGGMITDIGGFAAATYMRGIPFINIPTTILAMVDAAVGGKTGVNYHLIKNQIGVFAQPSAVLITTEFLATLDAANILSGYAEMLKHALLDSDDHLARLLSYDLTRVAAPSFAKAIERSLKVKERIVADDATEQGPRKALNLGHTIGHALESLSLKRGQPLLHGVAVAYGLVAELYLSVVLRGFPTTTLRQVTRFVRENYGTPALACSDYPALLDIMRHDKKNRAAEDIAFALLRNVGDCDTTCRGDEHTICDALDFLRDA